MLSNLYTGLNTAKGLAVAWQVPLVGINHMQAHALTPRLESALEFGNKEPRQPGFPFLSLLVSGGHTLLVHSRGLVDHDILANTTDIAVGDALDKMARSILPKDIVEGATDVMYGRMLEKFVFPHGTIGHDYSAPRTRAEELTRKMSSWGWSLPVPLAETRSGSKSKAMEFSFSGLGSAVERISQGRGPSITVDERLDLAKEAMRVSFEHLSSRVILALKQLDVTDDPIDRRIETLVVSGGVASNQYLKTV